ncbi:hypothetical protein Ae201684P_012897 [Aphanomyces euteiches]|nr:hypothetical protein Ae201684P_012897 [Aphanomyces euteiches]
MEDAERKMRRRAYMRGMMKIYRDEFKKEMAYLRGKEFQLLREIHKLIQEKQQQLGKYNDTLTVLPWKEVALALKRDADEASESLDKLREEVSEHQRLIRDMERWIQSQLKIPHNYVYMAKHNFICRSNVETTRQDVDHQTDLPQCQPGLPEVQISNDG